MPDDRFLHRRAGHSAKVNMLTDLEYRVWTQYLLSADDFGVMRGSHHQLQADNDHLANRPAKMIQRCLDALVKCGLIRAFTHQGKPYVYQHDWQDWQKVDFPRATNNPAPPADALENCEASTRQLFGKHPGGSRRARAESVPNVSRERAESVSPTRASAPAKRLTATGDRLVATANGHGFDADRALKELQDVYPPQRVTFGYRTETAFLEQLSGGNADEIFVTMRTNLEQHKASHEWRVKGMAPALEKWLREGLWKRQMDIAPPAAEQVSPRTARMLGGI